MKLTIEKRGPRQYYEEFFFILANFRKFRRKPNSKAQVFSAYMKKNYVLMVLGILVLVLYSLIGKDKLYLALIFLYIALLFYTIYYHHSANKLIDSYYEDSTVKTIEINSEGVSYSDPSKSVTLNWDKIVYVLINKYSICFLPENASLIVITVSIEYLDEILQGIKEAGKEALIVDNRGLYK